MRATRSVRLARNGEPHGHRVALRLERTPAAHTMGASGTALLECRFYGCLVPHLYNTVRPHSSLGYRPHAPQAWMTETARLGGLPIATRLAALLGYGKQRDSKRQ